MGTERLQPIEEHVVPEDPPKLDSHPSCGGAQTPPDMMDTDQLTNGSSPPPPTTGLNSPEELALLKKLEDANRQLDADEKARHRLSPCKLNGGGGRTPRSASHSRTGSITSMLSNTSVSSSSIDLEAANMDDLWTLWGKIVTDWESVSKKKSGQVKDLVRKGVPHHFRGMVWQLLCGAHESTAKHKYSDYLKQSSACEKVIRRDITRTYPEHEFFKEKDGLGQESLFNVMKAYSLHDREVGYCQGCGFITGLLLMQMPEEETFAVLVKIMMEYRLRELFKPSMAELGLCMFQLECMIQEQLPDLFNHFQAQDFCVSMFASSWFLTLFTTTLPLPVACRIFDIFLSEGIEMIFRIGLAILKLAEPDLMSLDMEGMITYMQKEVMVQIEKDPEPLFNTAFQLKYNAKKMKK
ncbi:Rab-GAP TBC domain-containing protein [Lamellibrachia satsuma]|nr:Rab-GAP TBC domain-containing protein [Lamellibrachia satsuma]